MTISISIESGSGSLSAAQNLVQLREWPPAAAQDWIMPSPSKGTMHNQVGIN